MEDKQKSVTVDWSSVPVSPKMAEEMAAPTTAAEKSARLMQIKLMKLAEKAFKRQQKANETTGKPFTAPQWKKDKK